jgi:hypothetical protein
LKHCIVFGGRDVVVGGVKLVWPRILAFAASALACACSIYELPPDNAGEAGSGNAGSSASTGTGEGGAGGAGGSGNMPATSGGAGGTASVEMDASAAGGSAAPSNDAQPMSSVDAGADTGVVPIDSGGGGVLALPFAVDSYFRPTGYMGDGVAPGPVSVQASGCKMPRPTGARGNCYKITYRPLTPEAGAAWGGVYWQYPDNNWGTLPGKRIAKGAKHVSFYAASDTTQDVTFRVGGIQNAGSPYQDSMRVDLAATLGPTLTQYSIDISGETYDQVLGPFAWVITTYDASHVGAAGVPIVFYLDDIHWE